MTSGIDHVELVGHPNRSGRGLAKGKCALKILILGASGMLGHAAFRVFAQDSRHEVFGTVRGALAPSDLIAVNGRSTLITEVDVESADSLARAFAECQPDVVINCIGVVKQLKTAYDPLVSVPLNSLLPHRLARLAAVAGARLVHISTDCVFTGARGNYREEDIPDALDLYGRSKLIGEVDYANAITLRTSIIGPELRKNPTGLVGWFLSQSGQVKGYKRAVFSGFPTVTLARIIRDKILPRPELRGLYHVSAAPIDKFRLLTLVKEAWQKEISIEPDESVVIDRSLNSDRFRASAGYAPPEWPELIAEMRAFS